MDIYIKGNYRKSIYTSENGYTIGIFKVIETNSADMDIYVDRTITFTGYFHELNEIDTYIFYGKLVEHNKYGEQFQVEKYERVLREDKNGIVEFLSSGLFKGIGEAKAKKIEKVLGKNTFKIILENPSNLILIPTITEKNAKELHDKLVEYESSYETIMYLNKIGFSTKDAMMIYNKYKDKTVKQIDENIYQLIEDIYEMYFKKIDLIATKMGILKDDPIRIDASVLYIMRELSNSYGHTYFYKEEIYSYLSRVLQTTITYENFEERLTFLEKNLKIVKLDDKYYTRQLYEAEELITKRLLLLAHKKKKEVKNIEEEVAVLEQEMGICYNKDQKEAIICANTANFLVITGGPGTGKTTIMKAIIELYKRLNKYSNRDLDDKIALLAPTGRAAKRMSEATFYKASTIHRFLKWNKDNDSFQVNEYNKSKVSFVLIDEASMIDTYLFSNLLKGLSVNTKIILVGDADQLPSVGPGQILHDIIASNMLDVCYLKELYRQGKDSNIISLAYDIRNNSLNKNIFNISDDLTFIECSDSDVLDEISNIASVYKDLSYKDFQVLAPMYKTINGIDNINNKLQNIFNKASKNKKSLTVGDYMLREGDKVIQLSNMPDDNVYNGDIGLISRIVLKPNKEVYIDFDGNVVKYTPSSFNKFRLAYAISIHKSQGSESDVVIIPLVKSFKKMLYRKLIYTGITRSKKSLFLIGDYKALELAVSNTSTDLRRTSLKDFLINGIK